MEACPCSGEVEFEWLEAIGAHSWVLILRRHVVQKKATNVHERIDGECFDRFEELSVLQTKGFHLVEGIIVFMESCPHTPSLSYGMDAVGAGIEIDATRRQVFLLGSPSAQYRLDPIDAVVE